MPRKAVNFDTVRDIGLALPGVEQSTAFGAPALKIRGKLMACLPTHRSAEPDSLLLRVGFGDRSELLAAAPDVYYVTNHYLNYTAVLVRRLRTAADWAGQCQAVAFNSGDGRTSVTVELAGQHARLSLAVQLDQAQRVLRRVDIALLS